MTTPYPEFAIASYVLAAGETNRQDEWMNVLTEARSDRTVTVPRGSSTCQFSNTSPREITIVPRLVYDLSTVVFLPEHTVPAGKSTMFKVSNSSDCYLSIVQRVWVDPKGRFGLEIITMPPAIS